MDTAIVVAVLGGLVTASGWVVTNLTLKLRENETRRLQLIRDHSAQQISEFYAPLTALTEQLNTIANIWDNIEGPEKDSPKLATLLFTESFGPVHEDILSILKNKIHLAEGREIPVSFVNYFHHYRALRVKFSLEKAGIPVTVKVPEFPSQFYHDVRSGLRAASARYEDTIDQLRAPRSAPPHSLWDRTGRIKATRRTGRCLLPDKAQTPTR